MIPVERMLVIAPHPDDDVIGCGGTVALAADRGADVQVVVIFDGAAGDPEGRFEGEDYVALRQQEARRAGELLGVNRYHFWGLAEGHLPSEGQLEDGARRLAALVEELRPQVILAPWEGDSHPDHESVAGAVRRMIEITRYSGEVWGFEVWSPLPAEHLVDVSTVWQYKLDALREHRTQLVYDDLLQKTTTLATRLDAGLLEAFRRMETVS
jgi:N-acetylglucosamine malate deacetylase 1